MLEIVDNLLDFSYRMYYLCSIYNMENFKIITGEVGCKKLIDTLKEAGVNMHMSKPRGFMIFVKINPDIVDDTIVTKNLS